MELRLRILVRGLQPGVAYLVIVVVCSLVVIDSLQHGIHLGFPFMKRITVIVASMVIGLRFCYKPYIQETYTSCEKLSSAENYFQGVLALLLKVGQQLVKLTF